MESNKMMEKYQENNASKDMFYEEQKRDKIKAAQEEVRKAKEEKAAKTEKITSLDFKNYKSDNIDDSEYLLCTGLFDEQATDLKYYKNLLEKYLNKKMICTNPDLIVDKGDRRELCAGSVAMVFEKMGGEVIYFGKPYPEVYNQSFDNTNKKTLSIGDNLNTDIKGANLLNYDSLLISNGVHKNEIKDKGINEISKQYESIVNYMQSDLKW